MARLIDYSTAPRVERGDGIESVPLTSDPLDGQPFVMGTTSFPPDTAIRLHSHNCVEQVTVIEGEAIIELDGRRHTARPWDTTQVAAGEVHRFINPGPGVLRILWVYGALDVTRTFADTGQTVPQFDR